jgi:hypothetical protein
MVVRTVQEWLSGGPAVVRGLLSGDLGVAKWWFRVAR